MAQESKPIVMVVDDNDQMREILSDHLSELNLEVIEAKNGKESIEIAQSRPPHLILMDANMPVLDGWSATMKLKENTPLKEIPVISITGLDLKESALASGADDFLKKPFTKEELFKSVKKFLNI